MSQASADYVATQSAIQSVIDNDDSPTNPAFYSPTPAYYSPTPAFPSDADATSTNGDTSGPTETAAGGGGDSSGDYSGDAGHTGIPYWAICGALAVGFATGIGIVG